jgi:hypothetical protein
MWQAFHVIAFQSLHLVARYAWPVSLALILGAAAAVVVGAPLRDRKFQRMVWILLATYVIPLAVMGVGALLRYDGPRSEYVEPSIWRIVVLWGVVLGHVITIVVAVFLMRGWRVRAAAVGVPGVWLSSSAGLVAAFAIAGVGP